MPKVNKFVYWTPRILAILFLLFLALFSLDTFDSCNNVSDCALGLFMHNIPVFVLAIILWISWKYEIVGAIAFGLAGIAYIVMLIVNILINWNQTEPIPWYVLSWSLTIAGPAFLVGILFWMNWKQKKKNKTIDRRHR